MFSATHLLQNNSAEKIYWSNYWHTSCKLSRGEIYVANFKAPLQMVRVWTGVNGQLSHLYKLGDWKTAESWPMLKFFWSESLKFYWPQSHRVTESRTPKGTPDTGG